MIINHNMSAINANRQMATNQANTAKSTEKLSSGLRINRAGDDAAGLAISEKMRAQVSGLNQATRNAQDGISMIQTAEGALNESHSILQRMRELSVQSSNDTNTVDDRKEIQKEIEQLTSELDRIGNDTEFNTKKLIDGSIGGEKVAGTDNAAVISNALGKETAGKVDSNAAITTGKITLAADSKLKLQVDGADIEVSITAAEYKAFDANSKVNTKGYAAKLQEDINKAIDEYNKKNDKQIAQVTVSSSTDEGGTISIESGSKGVTSSVTIKADTTSKDLGLTTGDTAVGNISNTGVEGVFTAAGAAQATAIEPTDKMTVTIDGVDLAVTLTATGTSTYDDKGSMNDLATNVAKDINDQITKYNATVPVDKQLQSVSASIKDGALVIESGSDKSTSSIKFDNSETAKLLGLAGKNSATQGGGVDFQIGANAGQTIKITVEDMRADALGLSNIDVSDKDGATSAIDTIDAAITKVSAQRSSLGAVQNRLEHTINNLGTSSENLTAAESRVRDVDMAEEMMEFTKNNVLSQASQAMLAQAKALPNQVLSLLQ